MRVGKSTVRRLTRGTTPGGESVSEADFIALQTRLFAEANLDYEAGIRITRKYFESTNTVREDISQHYELFAAMSSSITPNVVLEIGTFEGRFTRFLSHLFRDSRIITLDLPLQSHNTGQQSSDIMRHYNAKFESEAELRRKLLRDCPNVTQLELDSSHLYSAEFSADLIWVDGDHRFPVVSWDFLNCLRFLHPQGMLAVDDILEAPDTFRPMGGDNGHLTVQRAQEAGIVSAVYVEKRMDDSSRRTPTKQRKHIAVVRKLPTQLPDFMR